MEHFMIFFFLITITNLALGCVFNGDDTEGFYSNKIHHYTPEDKKSAYLKLYPEDKSDLKVLMQKLKLAAGPFDIDNAIYSGSSSFNYSQQGADWGTSFAQCAGQRQTPIDIIKTESTITRFDKLKFVQYNKIHPFMNIINNGYTVDVQSPWGKDGSDIPKMSGGPLTGSYQLAGVHFHWGYNTSQGSEHIINRAPGVAEVHFVHFSTRYPNISAAISSSDPESLAVVGIIFQLTYFTNPKARAMFTTLDRAVAGDIVFPALFPLDMIQYGDVYYTYQGSLTTPPCSESVRWIVVEKPMEISTNSLNILKKFMKNGVTIQGNYRAIVPLNGRKVLRAV